MRIVFTGYFLSSFCFRIFERVQVSKKFNTLSTKKCRASSYKSVGPRPALRPHPDKRRFPFQKRRQLFIHSRSETLSVAAMRVSNPDPSPLCIPQLRHSPNSKRPSWFCQRWFPSTSARFRR